MFKLLFLISAGYMLYRLFWGPKRSAGQKPVDTRYNEFLKQEGDLIDYEEVDHGKKSS